MLNAVTDLNVLNVDAYHKFRAFSVGRASVLYNSTSKVQTSMVLFFFFFFFFLYSSSSSFFFDYCHSKLLHSGL